MENSAEVTRALARFLDPLLPRQTDQWSQLRAVNELCLIEILSHNSVAFELERRLETDLSLKDKMLSSFPQVKVFLHDLELRREEDLLVYSHIKHEFFENGIEFLLIKSDGSFPYESDNVDVLIRPKMLGEALKLLKKAGYYEIHEMREPSKFLFRNMNAYSVLPLHIHTRVEWEGTQFIDSQKLWNRRRYSNNEGGFYIPSPEDCILITAAHLFFENHEMKLADLFKITSRIRNCSLDWDYMFDHARRMHWYDAFCLTMFLADLVHKDLFCIDLLQPAILSKIDEKNHVLIDLFRKVMKPFSAEYVPLEIPYGFVALFFLCRVLFDSNSSLFERIKHMNWVASDISKRRIVGKSLGFSMIDVQERQRW